VGKIPGVGGRSPAGFRATLSQIVSEEIMPWVGTWTTTPAPVEELALSNQTLRMITHVSIGGSRLRIRLSNAYGKRKLAIGAVHAALRSQGAGVVSDSGQALTFNGSPSITIAAGALAVSD